MGVCFRLGYLSPTVTVFNMSVADLRNMLRSRLVWAVAGGLLVIFSCAWMYVRMKTTECQLLCGEAAASSASYRVSGSLGARYPTRPHSGYCDCGPIQQVPSK